MRLLELLRPVRVVVTKRVSEEEQVSVEAFCRSQPEGIERLTAFLDTLAQARKRWNEQQRSMVMGQVTQLEAQIEARGEELRQLQEQIEQAKTKLKRVSN
jgi:hypothetical protein